MKRYSQACLSLLLVFFLVASISCAKKSVKKETGVTETPPAAETKKGPGEATLEEAQTGGPAWKEATGEMALYFQDIRFDYDKFNVTAEGKQTLNKLAEWLLKNTAAQILVEGHCDERGTNEYNLALGERRASSAKKYLVQLGINAERISTISYGEERPLEPGHNEGAWAKNRRGHFLHR